MKLLGHCRSHTIIILLRTCPVKYSHRSDPPSKIPGSAPGIYSTTAYLYWSTLVSAYGAGPPKIIGLTEGHGATYVPIHEKTMHAEVHIFAVYGNYVAPPTKSVN